MCDCNWQSIPGALLRLPLTRLHLRFADLSGTDWLPADAARLATSLQELSLPGCQIWCVRGTSVSPCLRCGICAICVSAA